VGFFVQLGMKGHGCNLPIKGTGDEESRSMKS
jgi:hypothetical protein